jgi:glucose-6-phosphate 1-dehydrogenase
MRQRRARHPGKPFGRDLASAWALNATLHTDFNERDIFRSDHYLGMVSMQNLLVSRFANAFFEPIWNHESIDRLRIVMAETLGVEGRRGFYEEAGAFRDVVQNHILQILGFLTAGVTGPRRTPAG